MNKTFQTILQIKATVNANTFLYYLKRLWVIGKHVPDRVYREEGLKNFLAVLTTVLGQLLKLFGKAVYLGLAAWLPLMLALEKGLLEPAQAPAQLVNILFFLSCVVGPMQDSAVFGVTQQKYIALKYMKMPPRRYVYADLSCAMCRFSSIFCRCCLWPSCLWTEASGRRWGALLCCFPSASLARRCRCGTMRKKKRSSPARSALCGCSSASPLWEPICRFCCG